MKIKVSKYMAQFLVDHGIDTLFTVTGGGAMHMNDSFGHQEGLHCVYQHHEQACAIAGEAYARMHNKIGAVCVTTGPGGTNAITGVVGGWLDSIPMLVISGQVRYDTTARSSGLGIRAMGDQEFDICKAVACMTKYCEMVIDPLDISYCLEKALYLANTGRPGPCWLDVPLNVQGAEIETDDLRHFDPAECASEVPAETEKNVLSTIVEKIKNAKRPVINAGNGIRISGGFEGFEKLVDKLQIPVVTGWNSIDLMADADPLYVGRAGIMGDRAGNFAIQNSDLVLSIGSRLSIRQVGYNFKTWAREAYTIVVDVDAEELKKPTLHVDLPVCADAKEFMEKLCEEVGDNSLEQKAEWVKKCQHWKEAFPVVQKHHFEEKGLANVYAFIGALSRRLPEDYVTVVGNGSACVVGSHGYEIKKGQRFIINSAIASMGYDLPAAIGVCEAENRNEIVCISGDGSIQMNLQELQTIQTNHLPIKIFVINNEGYHSIRQTQGNFFGQYAGIGPESKDLDFPDMEKIAYAYNYPFFRCHSNDELEDTLNKVFDTEGAVICEVMVSKEQKFEPKSATKRLEDGTLVSPPLEDLAPFLDRDVFLDEMIIEPIPEV